MAASFGWANRDSNPGPSACKADALNQLSYSPDFGLQIYFKIGFAKGLGQKFRTRSEYDMAVITANHIPRACDHGPCGIQYRRAQAVSLCTQ